MSKGRRVPPAAQPSLTAPCVMLLEYRHDDRCKTIKTQRIEDCTCKPEVVMKKLK